jgi:HAE1 family hydrophobic/amphiphilic exporter-1/multidrug efflux pump
VVALTGVLWKTVPGGLVPDEDQGYFLGATILPDGASLDRTDAVVKQVESVMKTNPEIDTTFALVGLDFLGGGGLKSSSATMFFPLKPWEERSKSAQQLVGESYMKTVALKKAYLCLLRQQFRLRAKPVALSFICRMRVRGS